MEQTNKLSIDIFSRPLMAAAAKDITKIESQQKYNEAYIGYSKDYNRNAFAYKIERELIALGVYKNEAEAFDGAFQYEREEGILNVLDPEDEETVIKVLHLKEFPGMDAILTEWCKAVDELKVERNFRQAEYKDAHQEAWGKIYTDLVAMGVYSSFEEAKAVNFTLRDGRYLEPLTGRERSRDIGEMMRAIFG
jgi:hypothetical protein